jgi:secreted PhoX family phosphatase
MSAFRDVLEARLSRRDWLRGAGALSLFAGLSACATGARGTAPALTFTPIGPSAEDALRVPPGYEATVLFRWGDPVGAAAGMPEFRLDASNSAADQDLQAGMHHDGMHFFPLPGASGSARGLLVMNHEYLDEGLLFPDGQKTWSAEKVLKAQHAVGVSVIEVEQRDGAWRVITPSRHARRITASSEKPGMKIKFISHSRLIRAIRLDTARQKLKAHSHSRAGLQVSQGFCFRHDLSCSSMPNAGIGAYPERSLRLPFIALCGHVSPKPR